MRNALAARPLFAVSSALVVAAVPACTSRPFDTSSTPTSTSNAASRLAFQVQPTAVAAGAIFTPPVVVAVQDALGNISAGATDSVTVAIGTNPAGGALSGTTTVAADNGFATFANLSIDKAGPGYTLTAAGAGLAGATSGAINVTAASASR